MIHKTNFFNSAIPSLVTTLAATLAITAFPSQSQALTFNFQFDSTFDTTVTPPIVGTGTFNFDGDPGDGTFALTSLTNYNFNFNVGGNTFTTANIATPVANVLARISTIGSDRFVNFGGSGGGPFLGSIDFINGSNALSLQPGFGPRYFIPNVGAGTYQGVSTAVPEPLTILGAVGAISFGAAFKRKLKKD